jgi:MFS family permease
VAYYLSIYPYFQSYLLVVQGKSVADAGRIVQMWTFAATITGFLASLMIKYTNRYKFFVILGACTYFLGLLLMVVYRVENASTASLVATTALVGIGGGMIAGPAQLGVQAAVSHQEVGAATAMFLTFLEVGGAAGSAISGAIWTANVPKKLALYLPPETRDKASEIYSNIGLASTGWPMGSATRDAINRAYQETMTKILIVAACVAVPIIILSFLMKDLKLDDIEQQVKGVVIGAVAEPIVRRQSSAYFEEHEHPFRSPIDAEEEPMLHRARSTRGSRRSSSAKRP